MIHVITLLLGAAVLNQNKRKSDTVPPQWFCDGSVFPELNSSNCLAVISPNES